MLLDFDYKTAKTHKHMKKKVPKDEGVAQVDLNDRDHFVSPPFTQLVENLKLR